jgi:hypothetical protein
MCTGRKRQKERKTRIIRGQIINKQKIRKKIKWEEKIEKQNKEEREKLRTGWTRKK